MSVVLRGGVVGYGFIASQGHSPAYAERGRERGDVQITSIADVSAERRERARQAWPHARLYGSYQELLEAEGDKLDFIDIATPPCDHAAIAHAAMDRGLHVLCEKPITTSTEEARSLLEHARRAQRVFFPCHNYKHAPVVRTVRQLIEGGMIGKVRMLTLQTFRPTHARGVTEWKPDWRRERPISGGGIAMDHGSHTFYLAFDWFGAYPMMVTASTATHGLFDTEDNFSATLTFPQGIATAHLSWTAGVRKVIYTVHGERGAIKAEDDDVELAIMDRNSNGGPSQWIRERHSAPSNWMDASHASWFNSLFDSFKKAISLQDYVGKEAIDAFHCIQLITTAYASASRENRALPLSPFLG